jgi:hypothetical protein
MSDWRIRHENANGRELQSTTHPSREAALIQSLHLETRQKCRIQVIEGPVGELIDRETFELEHLKRQRT